MDYLMIIMTDPITKTYSVRIIKDIEAPVGET